MAAAATRQQQGPGQGIAAAPASRGQTIRPFCQASKVGCQQTTSFQNVIPGGQQLGPVGLTASGGFLRRVILESLFTGGGGTTAGVFTAGGDAPFGLYSLIRFGEPNNTPIVELNGFNLLLADIYGGYAGVNDPRNDPDFSSNGSNPAFWPFIPIELDPTGMGALSDLSAASQYILTLMLTPNATVWSTVPNPLPSGSINAYSEYWTLPNETVTNPVTGQQVQQATVPPYAGTVQLWSQIPNVGLPSGGGNARMQLNRMGNQLRTIILVTRANGARSDTPFPNPAQLRWDDVLLRNQDPQTIRKAMKEYVNGLTARDTGVHVIPYSQGISRFVGGAGVSSLLPTVTDTRFELSGTFGAATAPTLDWVVNEVSSAPVSGLGRTQVPGGTAYYPPAPAPAGNTM